MELKDLQEVVYGEYKRNGFEEAFNKKDVTGDIAELGFITTEIGEAIEWACKVDKWENLPLELADIVIRVMNFCNRKGIDLERAILTKNSINENRGKLHGRDAI